MTVGQPYVRPMLPISVVIPTMGRAETLHQTLIKLKEQTMLPKEVIIVDGSEPPAVDDLRSWITSNWSDYTGNIKVLNAEKQGAAPQRNQGFAESTCDNLLFIDDDILAEPECLERLWRALESDPKLAGVSAMLVNEYYHRPGRFSTRLFAWLNRGPAPTYAGRCLGPGLTTYPDDDDNLPEIVPADWLITGCVLYRRSALPSPPFHVFFTGASIGEDLALSLTIGKTHKLANARTARAFHLRHHSECSAERTARLAEMELLNRYFIMVEVLGKRTFRDHLQFLVLYFGLLPTTLLQRNGVQAFLPRLRGRLLALWQICFQ